MSTTHSYKGSEFPWLTDLDGREDPHPVELIRLRAIAANYTNPIVYCTTIGPPDVELQPYGNHSLFQVTVDEDGVLGDDLLHYVNVTSPGLLSFAEKSISLTIDGPSVTTVLIDSRGEQSAGKSVRLFQQAGLMWVPSDPQIATLDALGEAEITFGPVLSPFPIGSFTYIARYENDEAHPACIMVQVTT